MVFEAAVSARHLLYLFTAGRLGAGSGACAGYWHVGGRAALRTSVGARDFLLPARPVPRKDFPRARTGDSRDEHQADASPPETAVVWRWLSRTGFIAGFFVVRLYGHEKKHRAAKRILAPGERRLD